MNDIKAKLLWQLFQGVGEDAAAKSHEPPGMPEIILGMSGMSGMHEIPEIPKIPNLPDFEDEPPHPWDMVISMRNMLPPHEQRIVDLMMKLSEAKEIMDEIKAIRL